MTITTYAEPRYAPLPPTRQNKPHINWAPIVADLKANPGQWAAIGTTNAGASMGSRGTKLAKQGIATTIRSNGDGTATVWACYIGPATCPPMIVPSDVMAAWFGEQAA